MSSEVLTTVVAVALLIYGLYIGSYVPPMFVGTPPLAILIGFLVQTVAALAGAVGVWWHKPWAPIAIVVVGAAVAFTAIVEGFVLGIVGYNHAVLVAVVGLVVTILTAIAISRGRVRV